MNNVEMDTFHRSSEFLRLARKAAKESGYDPAKLELSTNGTHKLIYHSPEGLRRFGARGYGDFIYYSKFEPAIASAKRRAYRARARVTGGKYSPGALALDILW